MFVGIPMEKENIAEYDDWKEFAEDVVLTAISNHLYNFEEEVEWLKRNPGTDQFGYINGKTYIFKWRENG